MNTVSHQVMQAHLDAGEVLAKLAQGRGQGTGAHRGQGGDSHYTTAQRGEVARAGDDVVQVQQQFFHGPARFRPAAVMLTWRGLRSSRATPSQSSNCRTCTVSADADRCSSLAALVKLPVRATARNA